MSIHLTLFLIFIFLVFILSYRKETKKKIVFFGDSITEQGVLIGGYIEIINRLIESEDAVSKYHTIGKGISGDKVYDLYLRIESDVLIKSPNITVVFIGINDVWCKTTNGTGVDIFKFEQFYRAIIVKLLASNSKIILCTPTVIGELKNNINLLDNDLNDYSEIIKKLGEEYNLYLSDLRTTFTNYINNFNYENVHQGILTNDGVHLNNDGNKLVANSLWALIKTIK